LIDALVAAVLAYEASAMIEPEKPAVMPVVS
jgi:hypothetical protein